MFVGFVGFYFLYWVKILERRKGTELYIRKGKKSYLEYMLFFLLGIFRD